MVAGEDVRSGTEVQESATAAVALAQNSMRTKALHRQLNWKYGTYSSPSDDMHEPDGGCMMSNDRCIVPPWMRKTQPASLVTASAPSSIQHEAVKLFPCHNESASC